MTLTIHVSSTTRISHSMMDQVKFNGLFAYTPVCVCIWVGFLVTKLQIPQMFRGFQIIKASFCA